MKKSKPGKFLGTKTDRIRHGDITEERVTTRYEKGTRYTRTFALGRREIAFLRSDEPVLYINSRMLNREEYAQTLDQVRTLCVGEFDKESEFLNV